jgi:hypothetical protein
MTTKMKTSMKPCFYRCNQRNGASGVVGGQVRQGLPCISSSKGVFYLMRNSVDRVCKLLIRQLLVAISEGGRRLGVFPPEAVGFILGE